MNTTVINILFILALLLAPLSIAGCNRAAKPVVGGTPGTLLCGGRPLSQTQVNVFTKDAERFKQIGIGYVASDGSFELITADSSGPLTLEPGTYHFTIESIGAEVEIPAMYSNPATTPFMESYATGEPVELRLPMLAGMK